MAAEDSNVVFDIDGDGYMERTGWVGPSDGILVYDADGDGRINGIGELVTSLDSLTGGQKNGASYSLTPSHISLKSAIYLSIHQAKRTLYVMMVLFVLLGLIWKDSSQELLAYLLVLSTAFLPTVLWFRLGAPGIPVMPLYGIIHVIYFAIPILKNNVATIKRIFTTSC